MSVDERRRLELADAAKRVFGDDAGITLMELLPPVGWADVATKQDLRMVRDDLQREIEFLRNDLGALESRLIAHLDLRLERGFRQILVTVSSLLIGGFLTAIMATVAAALTR